MKTPVLLIVFNRPGTVFHVMQEIRKQKPAQLYVAADGPRKDREGEALRTQQVRSLVEGLIDWPCTLSTLYRDENLGCKRAVSSAITWFFQNVEEGIILEDDTLPSESFFRYAELMLERYRDNPEVMHVGGNNWQYGRARGDGGYFASRIAHIWGWATWRRAWEKYDLNLPGFPEEWEGLRGELGENIWQWWGKTFQSSQEGHIDTWDYQWQYCVFRNRGLSIMPQVNLVENIGIGPEATHTTQHTRPSREGRSVCRNFPVPSSLRVIPEAENFGFRMVFENQAPPRRSFKELMDWWKLRTSLGIKPCNNFSP